jgi:hypothetical protein
MQRIKLEDIGYDPDYYPRVNGEEDWQTVYKYKEVLLADPSKADSSKRATKKWHPFPPIVVVKVHGKPYKYLLLDGLHRVKAFAAADFEDIFAIVEKIPESKWLERSTELNVEESRGLGPGDKAFVAMRLEVQGWKIDKVAKLLQMSKESLERIKIERCHLLKITEAKRIKMGRGNREIGNKRYGFVKSPYRAVTGTSRAGKVLETQGPCSSRNVLSILDSFLVLLDNKLIDLTDEEVVERMVRIKELMGDFDVPQAVPA